MYKASEDAITFADVVAAYRRGNPQATQAVCQRFLKRQPDHTEALGLLSATFIVLGKSQEAAGQLRKALAIHSGHVPSNYMLGNVLREDGQLDAAIRHYRSALTGQPGLTEAWINLGICLNDRGQITEAVDAYHRALALQPGNSLALFNLGNSLQLLQRWSDAIDCYRRALQTNPQDVRLHFNLGNAWLASGQPANAEQSFLQALRLDPQCVTALTNLGVALRRRGHIAAAIDCLDKAVALDPSNCSALLTLGNAHAEIGNHEIAATYLERVVGMDPRNADAHYTFGTILLERKQLESALASFTRARELQPGKAKYLAGAMAAKMMLWDVGELGETWSELQNVLQQDPQPIPLDCIMQISDDPALLRASAERLSAGLLEVVKDSSGVDPLSYRRTEISISGGNEPIRLAYISPDFGEHPVGLSIVELLERHDASRVEVFGISLRPHPMSQVRRRIATACTEFIDASGMGNDELVTLIRNRKVDIAVDLAGHTSGGRPQVFAARPAPLQVGYLGFAHTLGAPWLDYLIVDGCVAPESDGDSYTEKLVRLPNCFFPTDTTVAIDHMECSRGTEHLPHDGFIFCCFNSVERISPQIMNTWLRVLAQVSNSVLWLRAVNTRAKTNMLAVAAEAGIAPARLIFAVHAAQREAHLARHRLADLYLDTFPYNSHSTARDALYAGLPVLTCSGRTFASRVAGSLLSTLALSELVVGNIVEYEQRAIELAIDTERLARLRQRVSSGERRSLLFDTAGLARDLEDAYRVIRDRVLQGAAPTNISHMR